MEDLRQGDDAEEQQPPAGLSREDHTVFRFLDLPAELQNRIYEIAAEDTGRTLAVSTDFATKPARRTRKSAKTRNQRPHQMFPYLGLTQSCAKIRSDFRGWWMENHTIRLCEVERYMSIFWRHPPRKDRHRFESYFNRAGKLSVTVREADLPNAELLSLLKLKNKLPNYNITFNPHATLPSKQGIGLNEFVNNAHPQWRKLIRANAITSARPVPSDHHPRIYLVFSLRYAEDWMKPALFNRVPDGFLESVGLGDVTYWYFGFGVKYD